MWFLSVVFLASSCIGAVIEVELRPALGRCQLPPYPEHGGYEVTNIPGASPGDSYSFLKLNLTCRTGYILNGNSRVYCNDGDWSTPVDEFPKCSRYCTLKEEPSVRYTCILSGDVQGSRPCQKQEPSGTIVNVECNAPHYYSTTVLPEMQCIDGTWDKTPTCTPECGRLVPEGETLIINGVSVKRGELPWYAGIYSKTKKPYMQICGGSLLSTTVVISAAHCFYDDDRNRQRPAEEFAIAVGKLYQPWNDKMDVDAQKSDVSQIHIPTRYRGFRQNFQADIAIVIASTQFVYQVYVRPICLDFDPDFDQRQLRDGQMGKVAGWGLTGENGKASPVLKVAELPYVYLEQCMAVSSPEFLEYITFDKFCAGDLMNSTALCKGDSGGGLAFPDVHHGTIRYYLRGIASTAPKNDNLCNANTFTTFTHVLSHEAFIRSFL